MHFRDDHSKWRSTRYLLLVAVGSGGTLPSVAHPISLSPHIPFVVSPLTAILFYHSCHSLNILTEGQGIAFREPSFPPPTALVSRETRRRANRILAFWLESDLPTYLSSSPPPGQHQRAPALRPVIDVAEILSSRTSTAP